MLVVPVDLSPSALSALAAVSFVLGQTWKDPACSGGHSLVLPMQLPFFGVGKALRGGQHSSASFHAGCARQRTEPCSSGCRLWGETSPSTSCCCRMVLSAAVAPGRDLAPEHMSEATHMWILVINQVSGCYPRLGSGLIRCLGWLHREGSPSWVRANKPSSRGRVANNAMLERLSGQHTPSS